ncbi:MAG TPA: PP2C family protein-serine/threonine phosphatase [Streptomyces sp.]|nr:PP2C family protein-serine/threonine phosphatase [Streptomyces sp.]
MERYRHKRVFGREGWPRWLPTALLLGAIAIDFARPAVNVFPLLTAVPVAAAPVLSLTGTIAMGVVASFTGMFLAFLEGGVLLTRTQLVPLVSTGILTVIAAFLNRAFAHEREQLRTSRQVAEAVQRAVLPSPPGRVGGLAVATRYRAAHQEAEIGGDLYAIHGTPYGVRTVIGDVRGKGMQAVALVNNLLGTFHAVALHVPDLADIVRGLEARMRDAARREDGATDESFATAVVAEISPDHSVLRVVNRGHPAPLLAHDGKVVLLEPPEPSPPLGLGDLAGPDVLVEQYELPPGATLVMFTDGITEARDRTGAFFDPVPPLARHLPADPEAVLDTLITGLFRHTGELRDDVAVLAITRAPADGTGQAPSAQRPVSGPEHG